VADAVAWIMSQHAVSWLDHYIYDLIIVGRPGTIKGTRTAEVMYAVCRQEDMQVERKKEEGPATTITFLGLELNPVFLSY